MTFEQLVKANESIRTTDIKGKEYAEVNQRIKAFRQLFPEGTIETEILSLADGVITMKATVSADGKILATGHAQEKESSSFINKTSFVENCETSAVGRALGMLGIGIDTSVASAEEVENAILNQEEKPKKIADIKQHVCAECGKPIKGVKNEKTGKTWSGADIAKYALENYGRELCAECGAKEKEKNA